MRMRAWSREQKVGGTGGGGGAEGGGSAEGGWEER